jgi:hypothetical protein
MKLSEAIAALERGEEVEGKHEDWDEWCNFLKCVYFSFHSIQKHFCFRIKPKPVETMKVWVNFYANGVTYAHTNLDKVKKSASSEATRIAVPFREVVPLTEEERDKIHRISLSCGDFEYYKKDDVKFLLDLLKKQGVE